MRVFFLQKNYSNYFQYFCLFCTKIHSDVNFRCDQKVTIKIKVYFLFFQTFFSCFSSVLFFLRHEFVYATSVYNCSEQSDGALAWLFLGERERKKKTRSEKFMTSSRGREKMRRKTVSEKALSSHFGLFMCMQFAESICGAFFHECISYAVQIFTRSFIQLFLNFDHY